MVDSERRPVLVVGAMVDRYELLGVLGRGAMGEVWRARHVVTQGECALKVLHPDLARDERLAKLFLQEARIGARFGAHPGIAGVQYAGVDEQSQLPFMVMELLDGQTLEERRIARGPLPWSLLASLLPPLADAITTAHDAGVVHRDLKPGNLFLVAGEEPTLKILDFGVARVLEAGVGRTSTQVGTPAYAAPEQLGKALRELAASRGVVLAEQVGPATDTWALGVLAFDLLTGAEAGHYWGVANIAELMLHIALEEAPVPSLRAADPEMLPPGFDAWMAKCVVRDATGRYETFAEAASELRALLLAGVATAHGSAAGGAEEQASSPAKDGLSKPLALEGREERHGQEEGRAARARAADATPAEAAGSDLAASRTMPNEEMLAARSRAAASGSERERRILPWAVGGAVLTLGALAWVAADVAKGGRDAAAVDGAPPLPALLTESSARVPPGVLANPELVSPESAAQLLPDASTPREPFPSAANAEAASLSAGVADEREGILQLVLEPGPGAAGAIIVLENAVGRVTKVERLPATFALPAAEGWAVKGSKGGYAAFEWRPDRQALGSEQRVAVTFDTPVGAAISPREAATQASGALPAAAEAAQPALLSVNTIPRGTVLVDGKKLGQTPIVELAVPPGKHVVTLAYGDEFVERSLLLLPGIKKAISHKFAAADKPAASGVVGKFSRAAAHAALDRVDSSVAACATAGIPRGSVGTVQITFAPSGRVTRTVVVDGPFRGTDVGSCVARAYRKAQVAPFEGQAVTIHRRVTL